MGEEGEVQFNGHENGENVDDVAFTKSLLFGVSEEEGQEQQEQHTTTNGTASHEHEEHEDGSPEGKLKTTEPVAEQEGLENGFYDKHKQDGEEHHQHQHHHEHHEHTHEVDENNHNGHNIDTHSIEEHGKGTENHEEQQYRIEETAAVSSTTQENAVDNKHFTEVIENKDSVATVLENGTDHKQEEKEEEKEEEEEEEDNNDDIQENKDNINNDINTTTTTTATHDSEPKGDRFVLESISNGNPSHSDELQGKITSESLSSLENSFVVIPAENEGKEEEKEEKKEDDREEKEEKKEEHGEPKGKEKENETETETETIVPQQASVDAGAPRHQHEEDALLEEVLRPFISQPSHNNHVPIQQPTTPPKDKEEEPILEPEPTPTVSPRVAAQKLKDIGNSHFAAGRYDESIDAYTQAIGLDPEEGVYYSNRSAAYLSLGKAQEALKDGLTAIDLKPNWSKAYVRAGRAYMTQERYQDAINVLSEGLKRDSSAPEKEIRDLISNCGNSLRKKETASSSSSSSFPTPSSLPGGLGKVQVDDESENEEGNSDDFDVFEDEDSPKKQSKTHETDKKKSTALTTRSKLVLWLGAILTAGLGLYRFGLFRFGFKGK